MRNCFPAEPHEAHYAKQFEQLLKALTEKRVPFEGVQQRLLNYLNPVTYDDDLNRHLARFTGRERVMTEVEEWLASSRRVLWITGEAGVGKSALAAWLCDKRPEIAAYHFCRFGNRDRVDARKALFSLAYQLSTQLPVYQDRLNASSLDKTVVETNLPVGPYSFSLRHRARFYTVFGSSWTQVSRRGIGLHSFRRSLLRPHPRVRRCR